MSLDVWKPEVTVFPVQMLPDTHIRSLDPLGFSAYRLLWAVCPLSLLGEPGFSPGTSLNPLSFVENKTTQGQWWIYHKLKGIITETKWKQFYKTTWGTQVAQVAFSEYPNSSCYRSGREQRLLSELSPCRGLGGEATEGRPGTKAQGLASASDPAWRGLQRGLIHLLILFHFHNTFLRQPGLFKEYDWVGSLRGRQWQMGKCENVISLGSHTTEHTPDSTGITAIREECSICGQSAVPSIWLLEHNEQGYPRDGR